MAVPANIELLAAEVRSAIHGVEVREALASSMEQTADIADWARSVAQNLIDGQYDEALLATEIESKLNQLETDYAPTLNSIETEVTNARGTFDTLAAKLLDTTTQVEDIPHQNYITNKATKTELQAVASGSPKGVYTTLVDLENDIPNGDTNIYLVSDNGNWYYWDGVNWLSGGVYKAEGIDENEITKYINSQLKNMVPNGDFSEPVGSNFSSNNNTRSVENGTLFTVGYGNSATTGFIFTGDDDVIINNIYYVRIMVRSTNKNADRIRIRLSDSTGILMNGNNSSPYFVDINNPVLGQWYEVMLYGKSNDNSTGKVRVDSTVTYADATTATDSVVEYRYFSFLNLSYNFGFNEEPSLEDINYFIGAYPNYFIKETDNALDGYVKWHERETKTLSNKVSELEQSVGIDSFKTTHTYTKSLPKNEGLKIKLIGDSITAGVGGTGYATDGEIIYGTYQVNASGHCWANLLRDYLQEKFICTVKNWGISGFQSISLLDNISDLVEVDDDLVICMIGTNDRSDLANLYNNLISIGEYVREQGKNVIFMSSLPASVTNEDNKTGHMEDVDSVIMSASAYFNIEYISLFKEVLEYCDLKGITIDSILNDGLHPNDNGYTIMYEIVTHKLGIGRKVPGATW